MVLGETFGNFAFAIACRVLGLRDLGPAISPFNAFLILTGIGDAAAAHAEHSDNAKAVAEYLAGHDKVTWVSYAGLPGDRYYKLAPEILPEGRRRGAHLRRRGRLRGRHQDRLQRQALLASRQYRRHAEPDHPSLRRPPTASSPPSSGIAAGAGPDVVRLSVGIEDVADIIADLDQALAKV